MNNLIKKQHVSKESKYNAVFFPGFPGEYKDRSLMDDLKRLKYNIYSVVYPGSHGGNGLFSPKSVENIIEETAKFTNDQKLPVLLVTYSFSTYFILSKINKFKKVIGVLLFSPIMDVHMSIKSDFISELDVISKSEGFNIDLDSWKNFVSKLDNNFELNYRRLLQKNDNVPLLYAIGEKDTVINLPVVNGFLDKYRDEFGYNRIFKMNVPEGIHKLDSLYEGQKIYKIIVALTFAYSLEKKYPKMNFYLWGGVLNFRYTFTSMDIDVILVNPTFDFDDFLFLNRYGSQFDKEYGVHMDLSYDADVELSSSEIIRSNRGPSFIHELNYYYLPLKISRKITIPDYSKEIIEVDAKFADSSNLYKSKKGILFGTNEESSLKYVIKHFLYSTYYIQYLKGNLIPDQNFIEKYYKTDSPKIYKILTKIRKIMSESGKYEPEFVKKVMKLHEENVVGYPKYVVENNQKEVKIVLRSHEVNR